MNKICFGCGAKLQSENPNEEGYIPKEKLETSTYCQRCFRIMHYGKNVEFNAPKEVKSIVNNNNKNAKYVLFLTDLITLNEEIIKIFKSIKAPKILVISKSDIIPKSIIFKNVINSLKSIYNIQDEIKIISSKTGYGVNELINYFYYKNIKEVYILGETNAGKSSLINKMMDYLDSNLNKVTTSNTSNTTLDFLRLKLSDNLTVIDSPGFVIGNNIQNNRLVNPKIYQMKKGETLKIDDYYFNFSNNTNITIYFNKEVNAKKYYKEMALVNNISIKDDTDIIIKGEGFINIKSGCEIKTNISKDNVELRRSIFGGTNE